MLFCECKSWAKEYRKEKEKDEQTSCLQKNEGKLNEAQQLLQPPPLACTSLQNR